MNYKLLYFAFVSGKFGGVEQKVIAQFDALHELGSDVHLFLVSSFTPEETLAYEIEKRPDVKVLVNSPEKIRNPWSRRKEKFDLVSSILSEYNPKNTIVYFRYPLADIIFLRFLKKNKAFRFVTEHQEIENTFAKGKFKGRFFRNTLELLWGKQVRRLITGFVGVTAEITAFARAQAQNNGHYFETIGNGIDVNRYPLRIPKKDFQHNEIRILFLGSGYFIHGLDRLIKSIKMYYKNRNNTYEIQLKVVGDSDEMHINKDLVKKLKLFSKVSFFGNLENEKLNELFNWANIGVGSLAIHRKGLKFTSELKAREYCTRGLPFFWSTSDQDFNPGFSYILKVPKSNGAFNLDPVISFASQVTSDTTHPFKMRQFAIEHLDWSVKMKQLKTFCDSIIEDIHQPSLKTAFN
jgi:glycosyltransferase involved in cell wall biosynthesis